MKIIPTKKYIRHAARMPHGLYCALRERTTLFAREPFHPLLNNHALAGKWHGYRSINITGDWRAIYQPIDSDTALFVDVDTHHNLYGT